MKRYYTKQETMEHYKISQSTLQRMMRKGLPFKMFRGSAVYDIHEVQEYLDSIGYITGELADEIENDINK